MSMDSTRQMFIHELADLRDAEMRLGAAMLKIEKKVSDPNLKHLLERHRTDTIDHIQRLDDAFAELNEKPRKQACRGMMGVIDEFQHFVREEKPDKAILDVYAVAASIKAKHYEMSSYESLLAMARKLELDEIATQLEENLSEEKNSLKEFQEIGQELLAKLPAEEESDDGSDDEEEMAAPKRGRGKTGRLAP